MFWVSQSEMKKKQQQQQSVCLCKLAQTYETYNIWLIAYLSNADDISHRIQLWLDVGFFISRSILPVVAAKMLRLLKITDFFCVIFDCINVCVFVAYGETGN